MFILCTTNWKVYTSSTVGTYVFVWVSETIGIFSCIRFTQFSNGYGVCLLRGTSWIFKYNEANFSLWIVYNMIFIIQYFCWLLVCLQITTDSPKKRHRQCTYNVTLRRVLASIVAVEKQWVLLVCASSLSYPGCNALAPYCHMWPARLYMILQRYLINGTIFFLKKGYCT